LGPPSHDGEGQVGGRIRRTLTDLGNAERFVDDHGQSVRYCHAWRKWLVYDGKRRLPDDTGEVGRMMRRTVRGSIYAEASAAEDDKERKAIAEHARRSEAKARITDALLFTAAHFYAAPQDVGFRIGYSGGEQEFSEVRL
jgi:phage/plasmid-associated DNA primase